MGLRIIINDKEYTNPVIKYSLAAAALIGTVVVVLFMVFVILPIVGVSITALLGLFIAVILGVFAAAVALTLGGVLLVALFALTDSLAKKFRRG